MKPKALVTRRLLPEAQTYLEKNLDSEVGEKRLPIWLFPNKL